MNAKSILCASLAALAALWVLPTSARGDQIFIANYGTNGSNYAYNPGSGGIGQYTTSGATVNASLVTGVTTPFSIAASGSDLFVTASASFGKDNTSVGEYTTSGATVNASLVTGLASGIGVAVSGSDLFVANYSDPNFGYSGTVGEYTTSGAVVNADLITGLAGPTLGIAASGSDLFIDTAGTIAEYTTSGTLVNAALVPTQDISGFTVSGGDIFISDEGSYTTLGDYIPYSGFVSEYTTSGTLVNGSLVTGLYDPSSIAVSGSNLFVYGFEYGNVGEYTTSGATVNASLFSANVEGMVVVPAPEPSTWALLASGVSALLLFGRRYRWAAKSRE